MALTSCLPLRSGYFACSAAQPAGAAALAETGAKMPARRNAPSMALRNPATAAECAPRVRASVENHVCICFLLRRCHGGAMFQVRRGAYDQPPGPGLSRGVQNVGPAGSRIWAAAAEIMGDWGKDTQVPSIGRF